ncbi:MAG TPA: low temperature requirement protein A [Solirubrobacteraceae bacterium]|nr:low temperature requirement protein A [Solirubrobacteraceae bacterium]
MEQQPAAEQQPATDPPVAAGGETDLAEHRTTPVELLWDLVFVFAVTEVSSLMSHDLTWGWFARSMLVLALVWWAWSAFVWAANAQNATSGAVRACLLISTAVIFITGLSVPGAFGRDGTVFAVSYAIVRFLHLALYADASRQGNASWSAIAGFAVTVAIGMALLIAGSFFHGGTRIVLWAAAVAIDYAGPAWLTRERLRGLQHVAVAHFAERYGLFVIICLGESIVAIGLGAAAGHPHLGAQLIAAVTLALLITIGMWWTYFDRYAATAEERLREHDDPVLAAADGYSYLHLLIVAGIITFAVGARVLVRHFGVSMPSAPRLALCGGVALYLVGHVGFRRRLSGELEHEKLALAAALLVLYAVGSGLPGWVLATAIAVLLAGLCALETTTGSEGSFFARERAGKHQASEDPVPPLVE